MKNQRDSVPPGPYTTDFIQRAIR